MTTLTKSNSNRSLDTVVYSPGNQFETVDDFALVAQLMDNSPRYKIPLQLREKVIGCIEKCITDEKEEIDINTKFQAIKLMLLADKQNLDLIKLAMPKTIVHKNVKDLSDDELQALVRKVLPSIQ